MKTSCYFTYAGPGRIGVTLGNPRRIPPGYRMFKALAPSYAMFKLPPAEFLPAYGEVLDQLDPQATWDALHRLAGGHEPVLLCFEKPPFHSRNWCHRRSAAAWFEKTLGHVVEEIGYGNMPTFGNVWEPQPGLPGL